MKKSQNQEIFKWDNVKRVLNSLEFTQPKTGNLETLEAQQAAAILIDELVADIIIKGIAEYTLSVMAKNN